MVQAQVGINHSHLNTYFSLLFGFLVVVYYAGKEMTRAQVGIFTFFYLAAMSGEILGFFAAASGVVIASENLREMGPNWDTSGGGLDLVLTYRAVSFFQLAGVIASLYFLRSVRQPKTE